ncbi:MAG: DUF4230 domain-containing protein [Candidatus Aegiribacteria sp.]|nr:DUF4230 domain-containing protein [Candidatus Aegiribacteria sp.]
MKQDIVVPLSELIVEEGIVPEIADMVTDVSLEMFMSVEVEVTAGIDASEIRIEDYTYDEETNRITSMLVSVPEAEITYSMVDYFNEPVTHFNEGHVRNSMIYIMDFMIEACDSAETVARSIAVNNGILEDANESARREIRLLLESIGVEQVEFVVSGSYYEYGGEENSLRGGV